MRWNLRIVLHVDHLPYSAGDDDDAVARRQALQEALPRHRHVPHPRPDVPHERDPERLHRFQQQQQKFSKFLKQNRSRRIKREN